MFSKFNLIDSFQSNSELNEIPLIDNNESLNLSENLLHQVDSTKLLTIDKQVLEKFEENFSDDIDDNEIYLCLYYQSNKIACSYYDLNKKCLFYSCEIQEDSKFQLTETIIDDLQPNCIITSPRCDSKFLNFLKQKCKYDLKKLPNNTNLIPEDSLLTNDDQSYELMLKLRENLIQFVLVPSGEFNFDACKERIFKISTLESLPERISEAEKIFYFSSLIDFDSKLTIKSCGGLLKYLSTNRINFELERSIFETPIFKIKKIELKNMLLLDQNAFKSLQIFNDVDYVYAYKQTNFDTLAFRTHLNDKFNNTLYSLFLSRINTKFGIGKLRSFMLKPTRDLNILHQRHKIINFYLDPRNSELAKLTIKHLKKCKYINPILKRMRLTRCGLNDWKRLYRTTQSFLELCKMKRSLSLYLHSESIDSSFEVKFDFLVNLFERTIDLKESNEKNEIRVSKNISKDLDTKRQMYSQLPEFLTEVAQREMITYSLNGCKTTYLQLIGFLLIITREDLNLNNFSSNFCDRFAEFEQKNQLKFVFKSNEKMYYKTPLCVELDKNIGDLATVINDLQSEILDNLQTNFIKYSHLYAQMVDFCAEIDCLLSFASVAKEFDYSKPEFDFTKESFVSAKSARHPLIELMFDSFSSFIPNDIHSGLSSPKIKVITSPNASGKTVYLKQVALLVYMSYIGSYVPGKNVQIGEFDRILTRIKSNESINLQMSSYSLDLKQLADCVNESSCKSLVLIDELGNGTDILAGQAIVGAILRYWSSMGENSPHVFFSSHFYEMLHCAQSLFGEHNNNIQFLKFDYMFHHEDNSDNVEKMVFLYKLKNGLTSSSHALNILKKLPEKYSIEAKQIFDKVSSIINTKDLNSENYGKNVEELKILLQSEKAMENFDKAKNTVKQVFEMFYNFKLEDENSEESTDKIEKEKEKRALQLREILKNLKK
ncbi:mutS -like protein [Brachionus plicatilis]|uniref:MutS-like protein n=1 Tax=Brachionus plicatilis TaxID=10195 RepID=A0A3M7SYQ9_BRAPC|nr:mutS -like protein [Brachionus plicatilis]